MTHEFKDVAGNTYLSIDTSQPITTIDNPRLIEPRVEFNMGEIEPVLVISAGGKVTWMGKEVVGDEEFKQAMMDLNVKLGEINKTIQPALSDDDFYKIVRPFYGTDEACKMALPLSIDEFRAIEAHCRGGA